MQSEINEAGDYGVNTCVRWDGLALFNKTRVHITKMQSDALTPDKFIFKVSSIMMGKSTHQVDCKLTGYKLSVIVSSLFETHIIVQLYTYVG